MKRRRLLGLLAALALAPATAAQAEPYDFAIIGDLPYDAFEREHLPGLLDEIHEAGNRFVVHVGDIKQGSAPCTDQALGNAFDLLAASPLPLIYLPGDNDWADCRRKAAGAYRPLERLEHLRKLFFATSTSLGSEPLPLARQSNAGFGEFVENQRWRLGPALFVTLHIIGGDNDRLHSRGTGAGAAYHARAEANQAWLAQAFEQARAERLGVVFVFIHGNPRLEAFRDGDVENGYTRFLRQLDAESGRFDGRTVLVHGDTHAQRIDLPPSTPRPSSRLGRLTRIESYGHPFIGWVQVSVGNGAGDAHAPALGFKAHAYAPNALRTIFP